MIYRLLLFMILILSKNDFEASTEDIIDWLDYYGADYHRINGSSFLQEVHYRNGNFHINEFSINEFNIVWNRRWFDEDSYRNIFRTAQFSPDNTLNLSRNIFGEIKVLTEAFYNSLSRKKWLSHPDEVKRHKLENLKLAQAIGFSCPQTLITTRKTELINFINEVGSVVTKPISETVRLSEHMEIDNKIESYSNYMLYTYLLTKENVENISTTFFPSLFQQNISKIYEIRAFVLGQQIYSMAILSQNDRMTQQDFRNYNTERPNRTIPYKLPPKIERLILDFMNHSNMTTGSIDFIKSVDNQYIFLEINPVGQFGMVSMPCNYNLEQKIAKYLINEDQ